MRNIKGFIALAAMSAALSGCYVVPIQPYPNSNIPTRDSYAVAGVPLPRPVYTARLYPTNESAAALGRVSGTITNPERGHGEFSFTLGNERYVG